MEKKTKLFVNVPKIYRNPTLKKDYYYINVETVLLHNYSKKQKTHVKAKFWGWVADNSLTAEQCVLEKMQCLSVGNEHIDVS